MSSQRRNQAARTYETQQIRRIFTRLLVWIGKHGGGTFGAYGGPITLHSGYQVGGASAVPTLTMVGGVKPLELSRERFVGWYRQYIVPGMMLGAWKDDTGALHFDATEHVGALGDAFAISRGRGESHVWDWHHSVARETSTFPSPLGKPPRPLPPLTPSDQWHA